MSDKKVVAKPQDFKLTRFYVDSVEESQKVQKAMFQMGFRWISTESGEPRVVLNLLSNGKGWIYVDSECRMYQTPLEYYEEPANIKFQGQVTQAAFQHSLFEAADAFQKCKSTKRKESRQRKAGWIHTNGVKPEIDPSAEIELLFYDGQIYTAGKEHTWYWSQNFIDGGTIRAYRVITKAPDVVEQKTISLEGMLDDVVKSAGGTVTEEVVVAPDTNPKKQFGDKSIPLNLWPAIASSYGALGLYNGKLKYGQSNFNATPVEASIYIAGAMRHLNAWAEGEEFDPADGVPNLGGVLANIAILLEARGNGTLIDDRKLGSAYLKEREALKDIVASLQKLHADKNPRHYTIADAK